MSSYHLSKTFRCGVCTEHELFFDGNAGGGERSPTNMHCSGWSLGERMITDSCAKAAILTVVYVAAPIGEIFGTA